MFHWGSVDGMAGCAGRPDGRRCELFCSPGQSTRVCCRQLGRHLLSQKGQCSGFRCEKLSLKLHPHPLSSTLTALYASVGLFCGQKWELQCRIGRLNILSRYLSQITLQFLIRLRFSGNLRYQHTSEVGQLYAPGGSQFFFSCLAKIISLDTFSKHENKVFIYK